jgi:uncharacterized protein YoxC
MITLLIALGIFGFLALIAFCVHLGVTLHRQKAVVESLHARLTASEDSLAETKSELKKTNEILNKEREDFKRLSIKS